MDISQTVRQARLSKGFTQDRLATAAGLSKRTVQNVENGHVASPETRMALTSVLGVELVDVSVSSNVPTEDDVARAVGEINATVSRRCDWQGILEASHMMLGLISAGLLFAFAVSIIAIEDGHVVWVFLFFALQALGWTGVAVLPRWFGPVGRRRYAGLRDQASVLLKAFEAGVIHHVDWTLHSTMIVYFGAERVAKAEVLRRAKLGRRMVA